MTALPLVPALAAAASALAAMTARTSGPGLMRAWEQYQNRHTVDQGAQQAAQEAAKQDDKAEGVGTGLSPVDPKEPCGACGEEKKEKRKNDPIKDKDKLERQMQQRGWTHEQIEEAVKNGKQFTAKNFQTGGDATRYVHPETGRSVIIDNRTGGIIQVGGDGFKF